MTAPKPQLAIKHIDPDADIIFTPTPTSMINRLLPVVSTDSLVAYYVNYHFGTHVTAERIGELRAIKTRENRKSKADSEYSALGDPIGGTPEDKARKQDAAKGSRLLAQAVRAAKQRAAS